MTLPEFREMHKLKEGRCQHEVSSVRWMWYLSTDPYEDDSDSGEGAPAQEVRQAVGKLVDPSVLAKTPRSARRTLSNTPSPEPRGLEVPTVAAQGAKNLGFMPGGGGIPLPSVGQRKGVEGLGATPARPGVQLALTAMPNSIVQPGSSAQDPPKQGPAIAGEGQRPHVPKKKTAAWRLTHKWQEVPRGQALEATARIMHDPVMNTLWARKKFQPMHYANFLTDPKLQFENQQEWEEAWDKDPSCHNHDLQCNGVE